MALLARRLEQRQHAGRYRSTQENAIALLALGKYAHSVATASQGAGGSATWRVGDASHSGAISAATPLQRDLPEVAVPSDQWALQELLAMAL